MAMGEERKNKEDEEFAKVFHSTTCEFDEDEEFAKVFNMTAFEFNENEGAREFDEVFYTDKFEQDSGYQEVLCPLLRRGCSQGSSRHSYNSGPYMQDAIAGWMKESSDNSY